MERLDELFDTAERVLKGEESVEKLKEFPEGKPVRKPVENPFKRSALIVSGDRVKHLRKVFSRPADVIIFNVEDGVSDERKPFARLLIRKLLLNTDFDGSKEIVVRVNPIDSRFLYDDLTELLPTIPHAFRLSKVRSPEDVVALDRLISAFETSRGVEKGFIKIQLSIETPEAVERLAEILSASERINAVYLGILDLFGELSLPQKFQSGKLGEFVRTSFVFHSLSHGVYPIAPAYQDYKDLEGFEREAELERQTGFSGKMCISVKQVEIANRIFSPTEEEIEEARQIVEVYEKAIEGGKGGVAWNGKFIDQPIYKSALNTLRFSRL